jgi:hypothetical protein
MARHVLRFGINNKNNSSVGHTEGNRSLCKRRQRSRVKDADCIQLAQDGTKWRALVKMLS